jgi:transposase
MGTIRKKTIKGNNYYYYVESMRIDGKPKNVNQKYLGSADALLKLKTQSSVPLQETALYSHVASYGDVVLLYDLFARLGIVDIIDAHAAKRKQGASVGQYIMVEAINRAVSPSSTDSLQDWYAGTCLPSLMGMPAKTFSSQNFWNNMGISTQQIQAIEDDILARIIGTYDIDVSEVIYDATNFFTYIDTMADCECAQRGHDKAKRNDLRTVGLAMMVTPGFSIPLVHETYPGNRPDSKQFRAMMGDLKKRIRKISGKDLTITVVFDRGNNSEDNFDYLVDGDDLPFHYVSGLKKNQCKALFAVDKSQFTPLEGDGLEGQRTFRMSGFEAYGQKATAIVVDNPKLREGQLQGVMRDIDKASNKLEELRMRLIARANGDIRGGKAPTVESVTASAKGMLSKEFMARVFWFKVTSRTVTANDREKNFPLLEFGTNTSVLNEIIDRELGKSVLFTDRGELSDGQIVTSYRNAWYVEHGFRQMKDTSHLSVRPLFHWKDERIKVHIFICVLAFRLCSLLRLELDKKGIQASTDVILDEMERIKTVDTFFGNPDKPTRVQTFSKGGDMAEKIIEIYNLKKTYIVR